MLEIDNENDDAKWEKNIEETEEDRDEMFYAVRDSFERLSTDLGGDYFMSATSDYIKKFMNSQNWIEVHAAYTAMAFMSEGCKDSFSKNLKEFMQFISTGYSKTPNMSLSDTSWTWTWTWTSTKMNMKEDIDALFHYVFIPLSLFS